MNLHQIASGAIGSVNPFKAIVITQNTGYTTAPDGRRTPTTATINTTGQVQNLSARELQQLAGLNLEGDIATVWLNGNWEGVLRASQKGGDMFAFDGGNWLAVQVLETWPDWCRVAVCRQVA